MNQDNQNGEHDRLEASKTHARAAAAEMRDAATEAAGELKERVGEFAGEWKERAKGWQKELDSYVREHPTKSILTAVGVGFVLGVIFRR